VYGSGYDLEYARSQGWLFPSSGTVPFWSAWDVMYGGVVNGHVAWSSLAECVPTWMVMLLIIALDNMLKLASTESSLAIDFDYNHEMKVGGATTMSMAFLCGSPAYSQTKFNVLGTSHPTPTNADRLVTS
jgi:MFS superfamily sulfate permease-like transporter